MTVEETYKYLESVRKISNIIENKRQEYEDIFSIATQMNVKADGMPHATGTSDKVGNACVKLNTLSDQINQNIVLLANFKNEVITNIEKLSNIHYKALYCLYINGLTIGEYADSEKKRVNTVKKYRSEAVKSLAKIIEKESDLYMIVKSKF